MQTRMMAGMVGAAVLGFVEKSSFSSSLPTVPLLGRKGTIALIGYFWRKNGGPKVAEDVAIAAGILSAYELSKDGKISGEDDE